MSGAIRIEIEERFPHAALEKKAAEARDHLGLAVTHLHELKIYHLKPHAAHPEAIEILREVFYDPILQKIHLAPDTPKEKGGFVIEVSYRPGVTDNAARAAEEALAIAGLKAVVTSGSVYFVTGIANENEARKLGEELLANQLLQKIEILPIAAFIARDRFRNVSLPEVSLSAPPAPEIIPLNLSDEKLEELSRTRCLALSVPELRHAEKYFEKEGRSPTDVELEIIAQSWSEHCKHKIFGAAITFTDANGTTETINSLYKTYIKRATEEITTERSLDWLISVFSDNAGIVRFDPNIDLCIKVETHNSPSALDPYGGALTGILGVNRDILGCGMGARPIANTDVFCFAPPDMAEGENAAFMPEGPKTPRRMLEGVHRGVVDGGNKSGIPTVNGAFFFDRNYAGKPLVFVGTIGVLPQKISTEKPAARKYTKSGDRVFMVGGAIGADGIHGATFSSLALDENAPSTAVQIGDPLTQKRMTDFILAAQGRGLYSGITDNGAGGLSSSVGEMALITHGAEIDLALCPLKYPNLTPWQIMVSESQERMTVSVPPEHAADFKTLADTYGVLATDIGAFDTSGFLKVLYAGKIVAKLDLHFLHHSLPPMTLRATWSGEKKRDNWLPSSPARPKAGSVRKALLTLLSAPNITSKEKWVRVYDHEVQAATHQKPFIGKDSDAPADGGVLSLAPHGGENKNAIAIACGMAPRLSMKDPYLMAQCAVDEAMRNIVASGGDPDACCLLDNFCWPDPVLSATNPDGDEKLGQLVLACKGLFDICKAYGTPLVSGKDSMKNDYRGKNKKGDPLTISILPTLMITAMAKSKIGLAIGSDLKKAGDLIYLVGSAADTAMYGSEYAEFFETNDIAPKIDLEKNISLYRSVHLALKENILRSIHDVSDGGLLTALAEKMIGGKRGVTFQAPLDHTFLFNEAPGRFVVSIAPQHKNRFEELLKERKFLFLGTATDDPSLETAAEKIALQDILGHWKKGF